MEGEKGVDTFNEQLEMSGCANDLKVYDLSMQASFSGTTKDKH